MDEVTAAKLGSPVLRRTSVRTGAWWAEPATIAAALTAFGIYSFWAAWQNAYFEFGPYLSPFYSPHIPESALARFGIPRDGVLRNLFSPAFFILWMPLGFRLTCYYYRKAIYRSFLADPPGCAVKEPALRKTYRGETRLPFILMNSHRYFFYLAVVVLAVLTYDAVLAFIWPDGFGIGVGTLVMLANVVLLAGFTFGCNSARHLVGGRLDCFSCDNFSQSSYKGWKFVSTLNKNHMMWAWWSLISVGLTDVYIRLCATGLITDVRLF